MTRFEGNKITNTITFLYLRSKKSGADYLNAKYKISAIMPKIKNNDKR